jgi:hypothetical protein
MGEDYIFCCQVFYYAQRFASVDKCLYHYVQYNPNNVTRTAAFNVECQASAIREVEMFYREKGVLDIVKNEINQRKFVAKLPLLIDKHCIDVVRWRNLFPECNNVWKGLSFSRGNTLMFQLAQSPFYWFLPVIVKLRK